MKQRISSLDLKLLVNELEKSIKGYRLQNINNLVSNTRSFLLKFNIPDSRVNVVLESGFKIYTTDFQRPTQPEPTGFTQKLRKHLKTRRLTNIKQIGNDRVAVMEFSDGMYYIVLEFFSAGNIILLDENFKILTLFRTVDESQNKSEVSYNVGDTYNAFDKSLFDETEDDQTNRHFTNEEIQQWVDLEKTKDSKKVLSIAKLCFMNALHLSSDLIQINLSKVGVNPSASCLDLDGNHELTENVLTGLNNTVDCLNDLLDKPIGHLDGYIVSKRNPLFDNEKGASPDNLEYIYDEFHPYEPVNKLKEDTLFETFKGYNKTVDKFFTTIEMTKMSLSRQVQKSNAEKRLQFVKDEHAKKIESLNVVQELNTKKGNLIMMYSNEIESCKQLVQSYLDKQTDWKNIEKLIEVQKTRGDGIAKMIKSLNLIKNEIVVSLVDNDYDEDDQNSDSDSDSDTSDSESDSDEDEQSTKSNLRTEPNTVDVVIDLSLSAFANSSRYFTVKKSATEKQKKTELNATHAIKSSEKKIQLDLKKLEKESKQNVEFKQLRAKHWFEKYYWFISSEGYLCVAGRDASQTDILYYKYFDNESDFLVSNDLDDALKVFIKNPFKNKDVPVTTFIQAGAFSLSTTKAWENKNVISPWYVKGKDVSKKDFDATILSPGLLSVSKEKTYLPPCQLNMGAGLLWIGDQDTTDKYKKSKSDFINELELKLVDAEESRAIKATELKDMLEKLKLKEEAEKNQAESYIKGSNAVEEVEDEFEDDSEIVKPGIHVNQIQARIRGKKSKLKKIKEKYGDQDEEERRLRMLVLGTLKQQEQEKSSENVLKSDSKAEAAYKKQKKTQQKIHQLNKLIEELESPDVPDVEEDILHRVVDKDPYYIEIAGLIPSPNKTNVIEDCVPIFAPWQSLQKYAYKVKVLPGTLKKGKTVADIMECFKKQTKELQKEGADWFDKSGQVELINQQEFMAMLTASKFKVSYSGGSNDSKGGFKGSSKGGSKGGKGSKAKGKKK